MADNNLNPAYVQGLTARNRLTDARGEIWNLLDVLPVPKQVVVARIYNALCQVQGELEKLLEDVPTVVHVEASDNTTGGSHGE
jgi:hypothetical protein